jgi:hypothetical protein
MVIETPLSVRTSEDDVPGRSGPTGNGCSATVVRDAASEADARSPPGPKAVGPAGDRPEQAAPNRMLQKRAITG